MNQEAFRALLSTAKPAAAAVQQHVTVKERKAASPGKGEKPSEALKPRSAKSKGKEKQEEPSASVPSIKDSFGTAARPSKGLDFDALERDKQEQAAQAELAAEDDLEAAFQGEAEEPIPKKRTREELLAELREQQSAARNGDATVFEKAKAEGKFKRVGEKEKTKAPATTTVVDPKTGKVKKLRKKAKKASTPVEAKAPALPPAEPKDEPVASTSAAPLAKEPDVRQDEDEEDNDIFAGAADYDPFASDDEEKPAAVTNGRAPVKLFDDDEEIRADPLAAPAKRPSPPPAAATQTASKGKARESDSDEEEERPMRLEGFADSSDIKALLQIDDDAIKDEKRKERKERKRAIAAGEAPPPKKQKTLSKQDKLNRDFQEYQNWEKQNT